MIRDESRIQELRNSIAEGEMIIQSRKTATGRVMHADEIDAVKKSIDNARNKIRVLGE